MSKLLLTAAANWSLLVIPVQTGQAQNEEVGRAVFTHNWQPNDSNSPNGDGLGPMFNAQSCAQCHHQGGLGGGGDLKFNLDFATSGAKTKTEVKELLEAHPGFRASNGEVSSNAAIHRFSLDEEYTHLRSTVMRYDGATANTERDKALLQWAIGRHPHQMVQLNSKVKVLRSQ